MWSKDALGYIAEQTKINERYVAVVKAQKWLNQGYSVRDIALMWNQGSTGACRKGTNKHGVSYNSCAYADSVLAYYHN